MATHWRFSLKALLSFVALLSAILAMIVSGCPPFVGLGIFSSFPFVGASIGFVAGGWSGARTGVDVGSIVLIVLMAAGLFLLVTS